MDIFIRLGSSKELIAEICSRHKIEQLSIFGSALRDDFNENSDVDVLISFEPSYQYSLFDIVEIKEELEQLFGRAVDVQTVHGVKSSRNDNRKSEILRTAEAIYGKTA